MKLVKLLILSLILIFYSSLVSADFCYNNSLLSATCVNQYSGLYQCSNILDNNPLSDWFVSGYNDTTGASVRIDIPQYFYIKYIELNSTYYSKTYGGFVTNAIIYNNHTILNSSTGIINITNNATLLPNWVNNITINLTAVHNTYPGLSSVLLCGTNITTTTTTTSTTTTSTITTTTTTTTTTSSTSTTSTIPPQILSFSANRTTEVTGGLIRFNLTVNRTSNSLSKGWLGRNNTFFGFISASNGSNYINWNTSGFYGKYIMKGYINDSVDNIISSNQFDVNITSPTTSTSTTTLSGPTTTTTTTTTTTSTTLFVYPLYNEIVVPSGGDSIYVDVNRIITINSRAICGNTVCSLVEVTLHYQNITVLSPNPILCGNLDPHKQCNATFSINVTGAMNHIYYEWTSAASTTDNFTAVGFNLTSVEPSYVSSAISSVMSSPHYHSYNWQNSSFDIVTNVTCTRGHCSNIYVYLEKGVNITIPTLSGTPLYALDNPVLCGDLWQGEKCSVIHTLNTTGTVPSTPRIYSISNDSTGATSISNSIYDIIMRHVSNSSYSVSRNNTILCNVTSTDDDGDQTHIVNSSIRWYANNTNILNGTQTMSCSNVSKCKKNDILYCFACVADKYGYDDECSVSNGVYVTNAPPVVYPYITPKNATTSDNLMCNPNATDSDGDPLTISYKWFNNNVTSLYTSQSIGSLALHNGDNWICQVDASDTINITKANSSVVSINSACSTVPILHLPPNWTQVSGLPIYFSWYQSTVNGIQNNSITYYLQVSNRSDFSSNVVDISVLPPFYSSNTNIPDGIYYWRVKSLFGACSSNWSSVWKFGFVQGSCHDGIKNYHDGQQEVGIDCGGSCTPCHCAGLNNSQISVWGTDSVSGAPTLVNVSTTSAYDYENHCYDGCFTPSLGESDVDCGGFGQWACPACGIGKNCTSSYECIDGSFCQKFPDNASYGICTTNIGLSHCSDKIFNPTATESDIDCGGDCNRCSEGKKCRSTLDCQDDLVCSPFDVCVKQTNVLMRKKGRQEGGVGVRGYSMNLKYCSGKGDQQFQANAKGLYSRYLNCATLAKKPTDPYNLNLMTVNSTSNVFSIPIDTSGFSVISDKIDQDIANGIDLSNRRLQYHLEMFLPYANTDPLNPNAGVYVPYYIASDGQEYPCKTDADCTSYGLFDEESFYDQGADSLTGLVFPTGKCSYGSSFVYNKDVTYTSSSSSFDNIINYGVYQYDSLVYGKTMQADCASVCRDAESKGNFDTGCPDECKHCLPMSDSSLIQGQTDIEKAFCAYLPICSGRQFRLSARLVDVNTNTNKENILPTPFGKVYYQDFTAPKKDDRSIEINSDYKSSDNYIYGVPGVFTTPACSRPLFWDMTRCDGEGKITSEVASSSNPEKTYYDTTGCAYYDDTRLKTYASVGCNVIPTLNTLKEASCPDGKNPVRVLLDFSNIYKDFLSQEVDPFSKSGTPNKYYRAGTDSLSPKKIDVIITRLDKNDKECLVFDNLGEGTERTYAGKDSFDLYMGGDSVADGTYGPRIRIPLCKDQTYSVSLVYMDKPITFAQAGKIYADLGNLGVQTLDPSIVDNKYILDMKTKIISGGNSIIASISPSLKYIFPDSILQSVICRDIKSSSCSSDPGTAVGMLTGNDAGGTLLGSTSFTVNDQDMETLDSKGTQYCFADFVKTFKTADAINSPDIVTDYASWYGIKANDSATIGNLFSLKDNKWIENFWSTFNPFDISLPEDISLNNTLMSLITGGVLVFFKNVAKIILFIMAKLIFWALAYALTVHLWRKASISGGMSIYWILIFIIAMLIIFGVISSYAQFIGYLKFGL